MLPGSAEYHGFKTTVLDRRANPSYGYRAVHVICQVGDRWVEVQIRTELQHWWAQLSEKLSDIRDPKIKYGGGDATIRSEIDRYSKEISDIESRELAIWQEKCHHGIRRCDDDLSICPPELIERSENLQRERESLSLTLRSRLFDILYKEKPDDFSDPV